MASHSAGFVFESLEGKGIANDQIDTSPDCPNDVRKLRVDIACLEGAADPEDLNQLVDAWRHGGPPHVPIAQDIAIE
ncbi:MAG: hypothetical protein OEO83_18750 [Alphaproteobacteria bacterium]|nr:hypothetical protein [Alphaproteobacteria bacterium]